MADDDERVYTIPLARAWSVPRTQRTPRALRAVREFVGRHMKARVEDVWVDPRLNEILWARGREKPPRRVQVKVIKLEDETVEVSPLLPEAPEEEEEAEAPEAPEAPGAKEETAEGGEAEAREPGAPEGPTDEGEEGKGAKPVPREKARAKAEAKPRGKARAKARPKGREAAPKGKKRGKGGTGKKKS